MEIVELETPSFEYDILHNREDGIYVQISLDEWFKQFESGNFALEWKRKCGSNILSCMDGGLSRHWREVCDRGIAFIEVPDG